jgi:amino acid adenylation domain-containing protein
VTDDIIDKRQRLEELRSKRERRRGMPALVSKPRGEHPPLSHAQERLWFLYQLDPTTSDYEMPFALRLRGILDVEALRRAFETLVGRHEPLRTCFPTTVEGQPYQQVLPAARWELPLVDDGAIATLEQRFELATGPLLRTHLVRTADDEHLLFVRLHHIVADGWSIDRLWSELDELYSAQLENRAPVVPELPVRYVDYAAWEREWLTGEVLDRHLAYWKERLRGAPESTALPYQHSPSARATRHGASVRVALGRELSTRVRELAARANTTAFTVVLTGLRALLARYTGQEDLSIGIPIANRQHREIDHLIGMFVNTLVLRTQVRGEDDFMTLLARERDTLLSAFDYQATPFELVVDALGLRGDFERNPLFQVWMVDAEAGGDHTSGEPVTGGLHLEPIVQPRPPPPKFDLNVYVASRAEDIVVSIVYRADLLAADTMNCMVEHVRELLDQVSRRPEVAVRDVALASPLATVRTSDAMASAAGASTIWDRFVEQADAHAERLAVRDDHRSWRYGELRERAGAVAAVLDAADSSERVACLLSHGGEMVAGILGVLASGRTYVPLDPTHPLERLTYIIRDSAAGVILTDAANRQLAGDIGGARVVCVEEAPATPAATRGRPGPESIAYCLYTSGSTGRPKGVPQTHGNVVAFVDAYRRELAITSDDVLTLVSTFAFDAAVVDVFSALLSGATLCTRDLRTQGLLGFGEFLATRGVTIFHSTPTVFRELASMLAPGEVPAHVRAVVLGGEEVVTEDVLRFRMLFPHDAVLLNGYGMTECTWALFNTVRSATVLARTSVPLGRPADDHIEVTLRTPVGPQVAVYGVGTIHICSPHLALGYWNRDDETSAAFQTRLDGHRVYVTSDRGRLLPDGSIEFAGRDASHVKLRGFRIDLQEIEKVLAEHAGVREAAAVARDLGHGEQLVAYVVPAPGYSASADELRAHLKARLPDYMVPAAIMTLEVLPRTPSGKVDRRSLPDPDQTAHACSERVAPRTPVEHALAEIWRELLDVTDVGIHDDFFDLGGHSLLGLRLVAAIHARLKVTVPLRVLFEAATIEQLAHEVTQRGGVPSPDLLAHDTQPRADAVIPVLGPTGTRRARLLGPQRGTYLLARTAQAHNAMSLLMASEWLDGLIDVGALERALLALRARHAILRSRIFDDAGELWQEALDAVDGPALHRVDLSAIPAAEQDRADAGAHDQFLQRPFDFSSGEVMRALLVTLSPTRHRLTFALHRVICDPQSLQIFDEELHVLWRAFTTDPAAEATVLPPCTVQYLDLVDYLTRLEHSEVGARQRAYWQRQLAGAVPLEIPTDLPRAPVDARRATHGGFATFPTAGINGQLGPDVTAALERIAREEKATVLSVLLAAMAQHLTSITGQEDLAIISHLVYRHLPGLERTLGLFANPLVMRISTTGSPPFRELIARTHETVTGAFEHGEFDVLRVAQPLFRLFFNYLHTSASASAPVLPSGIARKPAPVPGARYEEMGYDLLLFVVHREDRIDLRLAYNLELFRESGATRLLQGFINHVECCCAEALGTRTERSN